MIFDPIVFFFLLPKNFLRLREIYFKNIFQHEVFLEIIFPKSIKIIEAIIIIIQIFNGIP